MTEDAPTNDAPDEEADKPGGEPTVELLLRSAGVLELTADGTDVRLTDTFELALAERIEQLRGGDRALRWLAASRGVDPDEVTATADDDRFVVAHGGETIGAWHSEAGFLAAIAAEPTVREWVDEERLADLPDEARAELSARLVMCLERCPSCETVLSFVEHEGDEIALTCPGCGAVVATAPAVPADDQ